MIRVLNLDREQLLVPGIVAGVEARVEQGAAAVGDVVKVPEGPAVGIGAFFEVAVENLKLAGIQVALPAEPQEEVGGVGIPARLRDR